MARHPVPEEENQEEGTSSHSVPNQTLHYVMLGGGLLLALVALIFSLISITRIKPMQAEQENDRATIKKLAAELGTLQIELKKARETLRQEKTARDEENLKQDELAQKIVENLAPVQKKLKISPTLQEQLQPASAVQPAASNAAAPHQAEKPHSPQVKSMLEAIKQFNEQ